MSEVGFEERSKPTHEWTVEEALDAIGSFSLGHLDDEGRLNPSEVKDEITSRLFKISIFKPQLLESKRLEEAFELIQSESAFSDKQVEAKGAVEEAIRKGTLLESDVPSSFSEWLGGQTA